MVACTGVDGSVVSVLRRCEPLGAKAFKFSIAQVFIGLRQFCKLGFRKPGCGQLVILQLQCYVGFGP